MSSSRKGYYAEEEKLLLDLKDEYDYKPWSWITEVYNNRVEGPRRHRTEDGLINKHKALKKKKVKNQARIRRIANNGRPEANIPIFTEAVPPGQSAVSHQYSPYFRYPPTGVNWQESETYNSQILWPQTNAESANKTIEEEVEGQFGAYSQYFIESGNLQFVEGEMSIDVGSGAEQTPLILGRHMTGYA